MSHSITAVFQKRRSFAVQPLPHVLANSAATQSDNTGTFQPLLPAGKAYAISALIFRNRNNNNASSFTFRTVTGSETVLQVELPANRVSYPIPGWLTDGRGLEVAVDSAAGVAAVTVHYWEPNGQDWA